MISFFQNSLHYALMWFFMIFQEYSRGCSWKMDKNKCP